MSIPTQLSPSPFTIKQNLPLFNHSHLTPPTQPLPPNLSYPKPPTQANIMAAPTTAAPANPAGPTATAALSVALALALAPVPVAELSPELVEELSSVAALPVAVSSADEAESVRVPEMVVTCLPDCEPVVAAVAAPAVMVVVSCEEAVGAVATTVMDAARVDEAEA